MLWLKAFHIIAMVAWFAGLFYLPRLFVYHSMAEDGPSIARFKIMERRLYYGIMMPASLLTLGTGIGLLLPQWSFYQTQPWMWLKLACVVGVFMFHGCCGRWRRKFAQDANRHSTFFYRCVNEVPTILLCAIVILVIVRPFAGIAG